MELYNTKIKNCGNIIKVHRYQKSILRGYKRKSSCRSVGIRQEISEEEKKDRRIKKLIKVKSEFIDIINYNFTNKDTLITLTYEIEENPEVIKENFKKFINKIKYRFGNDIKYCYVKYKQNRGVYHYHVILNIDFIDQDTLKKIWSYGSYEIGRIKNINAVATYMANHVTKETINKKDYKSKVFQTSRTCERPKWIYGAEAEHILDTISNDYKEKFYKKYITDTYGEMDIIIYEK